MQWPKVNKPCGRIRFTIKNLLYHQTTVQLFAKSASSAIINAMCFPGTELYATLGEMIKQPTHIMSPLELVNFTLMQVWYKSAKYINCLRVTVFLLQPLHNLKLTATCLLRMFLPLGFRGKHKIVGFSKIQLYSNIFCALDSSMKAMTHLQQLHSSHVSMSIT